MAGEYENTPDVVTIVRTSKNSKDLLFLFDRDFLIHLFCVFACPSWL